MLEAMIFFKFVRDAEILNYKFICDLKLLSVFKYHQILMFSQLSSMRKKNISETDMVKRKLINIAQITNVRFQRTPNLDACMLWCVASFHVLI